MAWRGEGQRLTAEQEVWKATWEWPPGLGKARHLLFTAWLLSQQKIQSPAGLPLRVSHLTDKLKKQQI